ncbi:MAG: cysteine--tRNA ligase [Rhodospirillales bacterium]
MPLHLHNTLTRTKEPFVPIDPAHVRMYVCGPTVYDFAHIGNARPVIVFDVLARVLRATYPGARVTYARNITDIDDKIIERSRESGETIRDLTDRTGRIFAADMAALGAETPTVEPRATDHVAQMIALAERLIANGHAYVAEGHVLFDVPSMPDYGRLSRRNRDEQIAGARVDVAPYKRDPADFVLWKPSTPDIPGWDSPWGRGRPGWHIECSAMAAAHLGEVFDIHGGGLDLIFPHHENEIAQSRCAQGTSVLANVWMHNGFVTVNGEKMSKSLGNFFTVHELLEEAPGEAIRLVLLQTHYRQPSDFNREALGLARQTLDRWYGALRAAGDVDAGDADVPEGVMGALHDDLNTPLAIAAVHDLAGALNRAPGADRAAAKAALLAAGRVLGLLGQDPEAWFRWTPAGGGAIADAEVERLIVERREARAGKDFARADAIRKRLAEAGVVLEDGPQGTSWRRG